jgi:hypothetical membrane protein
MMLTGLMIVLYGAYLAYISVNRLTMVGAVLFMVTGVFLTLIGLFPTGTEPHYLVSVLFFVMSDLSNLAWGAGLIRGENDIMGKLFIGLGLLGPVLTFMIPWPSTAAVKAFGIIITNMWVALMYRLPHE